jgi:hypothetical protein
MDQPFKGNVQTDFIRQRVEGTRHHNELLAYVAQLNTILKSFDPCQYQRHSDVIQSPEVEEPPNLSLIDKRWISSP